MYEHRKFGLAKIINRHCEELKQRHLSALEAQAAAGAGGGGGAGEAEAETEAEAGEAAAVCKQCELFDYVQISTLGGGNGSFGPKNSCQLKMPHWKFGMIEGLEYFCFPLSNQLYQIESLEVRSPNHLFPCSSLLLPLTSSRCVRFRFRFSVWLRRLLRSVSSPLAAPCAVLACAVHAGLC